MTYDNGELIRIPFVYLEENTRWIDNLQGFIEATNGILFVKNKKLIFRPRNLAINNSIILDRTNIITNIEEVRKEVLQNGIKVVYDRFEKLENQVVFNISNKIIVDENTNKDTEIPTMRINYISSSVSQPTITKASGYYFTSDDVNTLTRIDLKRDVHYVIEKLSNTSCEVKFYNPLNYKLYIDNFEIKGIPLVAYEDNEVNVMFPTVVEKNQENFITESKRKLIQTQKQAIFLAKSKMRRNIANSYEYNFNTYFLPSLEIGSIYQLSLGDFENIAEIESIDISLKPSDFRMRVKAKGLKNEIGQTKITTKLAGNSNSNYIDLSNIEKSIEENAKEIEKVNERFESISSEIQDSRAKIYTLKPNINTLTDENIGDMYISDKTAEILVKENNKLVWKPITDSTVREDLNSYIKTNDSKVISITYQSTEPEKKKNGDIWIDTGNDGIWKRYNGKAWIQIDENVRTAITTANSNISKIEKKITTINNTIDNKILAKAFVQDTQPTSGMKNHDIWYNPKANAFKKWLNNRWNSATEDDIFPALRHYVSLATAQLDIGKRIDGVDEKAGMFLTNNNTKFGAKNGTLAEVSLDKQGCILIKNANNLLEWNVKDPRSNKMKSRFYMGVQDVNKVPSDVYFKVGDEATGFSIELKDGSSVAKLDGQDLKTKLGNVDKNINNLSKGVSDSLNTAKEYTDSNIKEVDRRITNADGKLTTLQQNYQNTVKDITNFKTQTANQIDTVQGALDNGNFVVNGNTTFADGVRFVSRGTNEVITIANGSIDFHRDGKKLTRIKNSRYGTIATDSKGKGVVNFEGFKQPMIVLTSIKSANFGKNMASVFCYAEHISGTQYRMYVGGTNEHYVEAKPIKVVGSEWSSSNAIKTTLLGIEGNIPSNTLSFSAVGINGRVKNTFPSGTFALQKTTIPWEEPYRKYTGILSVPEYSITVKRNEEVIFTKNYKISASMPSHLNRAIPNEDSTPGAMMTVIVNFSSFNTQLNILKKFSSRTNVYYKLEIKIIEPNLRVVLRNSREETFGMGDDKTRHRSAIFYEGVVWKLTPAMFTGISITASAETSTISDVTGTGEVQYIAMEID